MDKALNVSSSLDYPTLLTMYRESSGYRDVPLTSRDIDDLVTVKDDLGRPVVIIVNCSGEPRMILDGRVSQGPIGIYCWHLREVESAPLKVAMRKLRGALSKFGRLDLAPALNVELAQIDAVLSDSRWRLVDAVTEAKSVEGLSDALDARQT
jgi:hypothetical protein